jgi:hypothetical protein
MDAQLAVLADPGRSSPQALRMSKLLHKCMAKATTAEGDQRKYRPNWITSRRGSLKVFDDHLECGDWRIGYSEIKNAVLYSFRSFFLRIPGYILTVDTEDRTYHFGLNGWGRFWKSELPFAAKREKGELGFTWFSIVVRLILVGYIGYIAWRWIASR